MNSAHRNGRKRRIVVNNNCEECYEEDNMDMVQCDRCDKWWHFDCAGVGREIENVCWLCQLCKENTQNPVTVSEKLKSLEKKFETVVEDICQLKTELKTSKDQFLEAKEQIAELKSENVELHEQLALSAQEIENNKAEISDLKKKIEPKEVNVDSVAVTDEKPVDAANAVAVIDVEGVDVGSSRTTDLSLPRTVFLKLPCKNESELNVLKENLMRDLVTLIYMEQRMGLIGGSDVKSCITAILNRLFSKELQSIMSLTGKRTDKPVVLMDYTVVMDLINNAVRISHVNHKDKDSELIITKMLSNK